MQLSVIEANHMTTVQSKPTFYFAENSAIWHINRERVLLLTGARVLLMQIAHPMVAEAVYNHSYVFEKPLLRLHRTLTLTLGMVFGTRNEVQDAVAEIDSAHRPATGRIEQGIGQHKTGAVYNPRNPRQALWVFATLVEGAVSGYETLVGSLSDEQKQEMLINSQQVAEWMGIPRNIIPPTYADLLTYMQDAIASEEIIVSEKARKIAPFITSQSVPFLKYVTYPLIRLNIALLPEALREQYGYKLADWEMGLYERLFAFSRLVTPHLPDALRFAPEYHRAMRLKGFS